VANAPSVATHGRAEASPLRVETGALDDRRHLLRQYAVAALGWAATIGVIVWLALHATDQAVRVTFFLATVCVVIALVNVLVAVEVFRRPLIRERSLSVPTPPVDEEVDALGRRVVAPVRDELAGELTIETIENVRRYRELES
jgi:hypothetical protein